MDVYVVTREIITQMWKSAVMEKSFPYKQDTHVVENETLDHSTNAVIQKAGK